MYHIVDGQAGNGARVKVRHWLDPLAPGDHGPYGLTPRQSEALKELRDRYARTLQGRDESKGERFDYAPDWSAIDVNRTEVMWRLTELTRHIPHGCDAVVRAVCTVEPGTGKAAPKLRRDQEALLHVAGDCLANALKM